MPWMLLIADSSDQNSGNETVMAGVSQPWEGGNWCSEKNLSWRFENRAPMTSCCLAEWRRHVECLHKLPRCPNHAECVISLRRLPPSPKAP